MPTNAHSRAVSKYIKNNYDTVNIRMGKGERENIKQEIYNLGYESVNQFIIVAIKEKIEKEKNNGN